MAKQRAQKITGILEGLGVAAAQIEITWVDAPQAGTGQDDWRNRRIELSVQPLD
jgi:outer membrane protein OmpA-like peptidoglycan-associated protein